MKYDLARKNLQKAAQFFPDSVEGSIQFVLLDRDEGLLEDALKRTSDILKKTDRANGRYSESERQNRQIFMTPRRSCTGCLAITQKRIVSSANLRLLRRKGPTFRFNGDRDVPKGKVAR